MAFDTFESKTFSKRMGEDSEGENSEEDFDELIMDVNYYQKQNKSHEPSGPLVLDLTDFNENTIQLIRKIEENLNKKFGEDECVIFRESTSTKKDESSPQIAIVQHEESGCKRKNTEQIAVEHENKSEHFSAKRICVKEKSAKKKHVKSFWSPGYAQTESKSNSEISSKINPQDPSVLKKNTKLRKSVDTSSTMTIDVDTIRASTTKNIAESIPQKTDEKQVKSIENSKHESLKPKMEEAKVPTSDDTGIICFHCDLRFQTKELIISHRNTAHPEMNGSSDPKIQSEEAETPASDKSGIKCFHCDLRFETKHLVISHKKTDHPEINVIRDKASKNTGFKCFHCDLRFPLMYLVMKHKSIAHPEMCGLNNRPRKTPVESYGIVKCSCNFSFHEIKVLKEHVKEAGCQAITLPCDECPRIFPRYSGLLKHKEVKHGVPQMS